jgi:hypothetical protein
MYHCYHGYHYGKSVTAPWLNAIVVIGGDSLQTEEHIFWDFKLYEDERRTMMDILSENRKKEYPNPVTELLRLEER